MTATAERNGQADFRRKYQEADENYRTWAEQRRQLRQEAEKHGYSVDDDDDDFNVVSLANLFETHPNIRRPIIDGLLREGETLNVIAAPKIGKSFLVNGLAAAISTGDEWLGFPVEQGRVLIVDAELHKETIADRLRRVLAAGGDSTMIDVVPMRGQQADVLSICGAVKRVIELGQYSLIILDALYRLLPEGTSENDNAGMMHVYNTVDAIAEHTGAAVAIIHHTSKGDQSQKGMTDVGSGAGSISRAADSHLILREHEMESCAVLEAVTRSWRSPAPRTIRFEYPFWHDTQIEPEIKNRKTAAAKQQEANDAETRDAILDCLSVDRWTPMSRLRSKTGFGDGRVRRGMRLLGDQVTHKRLKSKHRKNTRVDAWKLAEPEGESE